MPYLIFLAALVGGAAVIMFGLRLMWPKSTTPEIPMRRIATANHDAELQVWLAALRSAGIPCRVQSDGEFPLYPMSPPYSKDVWVKESDYDEARKVLGFPSATARLR